jgi:hypothetical protein
MALTYFSLDDDPEAQIRQTIGDYDSFLGHYADMVVSGVAKGEDEGRQRVNVFRETACDELIMFPASCDPDQVDRLAAAVLQAPPSVHPPRHDGGGMASRKLRIGGSAALAGLFERLRRRTQPAPPPGVEAEIEDEPGDELAAEEVLELREELRAELERLSGGAPRQAAGVAGRSRKDSAEPSPSGWEEIKASRTPSESSAPPG